jgi:hypothetical protein
MRRAESAFAKNTRDGSRQSTREAKMLGVADFGEPGRTRTCDPLLRRQMLYPPELRAPIRLYQGPKNRSLAQSQSHKMWVFDEMNK